MAVRIILGVLAIAVVAMFGQTPSVVKAGDQGPDLVWTRILAGGDPGGFPGRVTVIGFFPVVSLSESLVARWNQLVASFAGQAVRFVWITSEYQPPLDHWLTEHPVSGCVLLDPLGVTAKAYGIEFGGAIVDTNGRIAGFTFMLPEESQVKAVQDGRSLAIKGDATDSQMEAILSDRAVRLDSEPHRTPPPPPPPGKPDIPQSWEVQISPSKTNGTEENQGPDWWVLRGFDLKGVIAQIYEKDPSRIVLPDAFQNDKRYDLVFVPPSEVGTPTMHSLLQQAVERHFHISATVESRPADVYVMTAIEGKLPPSKIGAAGLGGGAVGWYSSPITAAMPPGGGPPTPEMVREALSRAKFAAISAIAAENTTMVDFRRLLEDGLGRPVVDETNLDATYDLELHGTAANMDEFIGMLRDQLGLVLTSEHRNIEMLVIRLIQ